MNKFAVLNISKIDENGICISSYERCLISKKLATEITKELQSKNNVFFEVNGVKMPKYSVIRLF